MSPPQAFRRFSHCKPLVNFATLHFVHRLLARLPMGDDDFVVVRAQRCYLF
jgi:hypothetical protein